MSRSPDAASAGLTPGEVDALRYDFHSEDPREVAGVLRALMPEQARVLDVGCGTGSVTLIANRGKGNRVVGVEPDPQRARVALGRGIEVEVGYLTDAWLAGQAPFEVVVLADVVEHVVEPFELLSLAHRALTPGGTLLVSIPNAVHWTMRWQLVRGRFEYHDCGIRDATHLRWFTRATAERLLEQAGFAVAEVRATAGVTLPEYLLWRPWRWLRASWRDPLVRALARAWPAGFACQYVLRAERR